MLGLSGLLSVLQTAVLKVGRVRHALCCLAMLSCVLCRSAAGRFEESVCARMTVLEGRVKLMEAQVSAWPAQTVPGAADSTGA